MYSLVLGDSEMKKSPVVKRNNRKIIIVSIITVLFVFALLSTQVVSVSGILELGNDFQFNLLNFSGVLAGFLFTGVGIMISTVDKERINRLWNHHYLDNMYYCAAFGILASIMDALLVLTFVSCNTSIKVSLIIIKFQIVFTILGLVYFIWCTLQLIRLISKLRD